MFYRMERSHTTFAVPDSIYCFVIMSEMLNNLKNILQKFKKIGNADYTSEYDENQLSYKIIFHNVILWT